MTRPITLLKATVVAAALTMLTACSAGNATQPTAAGLPTDIKTVRIGVSDGAEPYWQVYARTVKEQTGVTVEFQNFSDYNQPNPALDQKQLDLNEFQHLQYLATYNVKNGKSLQPIGSTAIYPLPLYSKKHHSLAEIPAGGQIAVPNDPTNLSRSLVVLEQAGLITVKGGANSTSTPAEIDQAASRVKVVPVDAKVTAQNLDSLDGAVVNNNYATAANLSKDLVLAKDDPTAEASKAYLNAFVARPEDKDNPTLLKIAAIYHDPTVQEAVRKDLGSGTFIQEDPAALQASLVTIQQHIASKK